MLKVVYIYRDPRDVVLSAMDHGNRILEKGERHTFAAMTTFDSAVNALQGWLKVWESYAKLGRVHMVKYEDLMSDPFGTMRSLCSYLRLRIPGQETFESIFWKYNPENTDADLTGLHYNKAVVYRYKTEMPSEQNEAIQSQFRNEMVRMGYEM